jgi:hypothetical protein
MGTRRFLSAIATPSVSPGADRVPTMAWKRLRPSVVGILLIKAE